MVFLAALVTALATGLGALPFVFVRRMSEAWLGISNAAAAGFMLSAALLLLAEGAAEGFGRVLLGACVGVVSSLSSAGYCTVRNTRTSASFAVPMRALRSSSSQS